MTDTIHNTILPMTDTTAEPEDYTGEEAVILRQIQWFICWKTGNIRAVW